MTYKNIYALAIIVIASVSCTKQDFTYKGKAYVQFSKEIDEFIIQDNKNEYTFEIHTIAQNISDNIECNILVDSEKSDLKEGIHFNIQKNIASIEKGKYIVENKIIFNYDKFDAGQESDLYLYLDKMNTDIGTANRMHIKVKQEDWIHKFTGDFSIEYFAKNKIQKSKAIIKGIEQIISNSGELQYKLIIEGLPVWTFSSGPKLLPQEFIVYFNNYSSDRIPLRFEKQLLATPVQYISWLMSFDYGDLDIDMSEQSTLNHQADMFTLNYKISLGNKQVEFKNVKFIKIKAD